MVEVRRPTSPISAISAAQQPAEVRAATERFAGEQGIGIRLTDNQAKTLKSLLAGPDGEHRGKVYLGLVAAGVGIVPGNEKKSQQRFDALIDTASRVWTGGDIRPLESFADLVKTVAEKKGGLTDEAVTIIVGESQAKATRPVKDAFVPSVQAPAPLSDSGTATGVAPKAPGAVKAPPAPAAPSGQLDLNGLKDAAGRGDWKAMRANLEAAHRVLSENPGAVNRDELTAFMVETETVAKMAEKEEKRDFWDILIAILTLGLSLLFDHLNEADHERVLDLTKRLGAKGESLQLDPEQVALGSVYGAPIPQRRRAGEVIPGTKTPWTPENVAKILDDRMGEEWDGTGNERQILDITHGLNIDDRIAVAEAYYRMKGQPLTGRPALDGLYKKLCDELDDSPFGRTRDGIVIRAQFDPANPTGQLQPHDMIMLDLQGLISKNGAAIQRLLMRCDQTQLKTIDSAMREKYGCSLEEACKRLRGVDERRALFLLHAPRVNGEVPQAYLRAFELRESVRGMGTEESKLFAALEGMSRPEVLETARAYFELTHDRQAPQLGATVQIGDRAVSYPAAQQMLAAATDPAERAKITAAMQAVPTTTIKALWNDKVEGDDGSGGQIRATALYNRLFKDLNDPVGGDELWLRRLALSAEGIVYVPDANKTPAEQQKDEVTHRERVARYVAVSVRLAGEGKIGQEEMVGLMGLVQADTKPGEVRAATGMPTANEVRTIYTQLFEGRNLRVDINQVTSGEVQELCGVTLEGDGYKSPKAAALRIQNAMNSGFLGLKGTHEEVIYEILDRPDLSTAERAGWLAEVKTAYRQRTGKDLKAAMIDKFGATLELPGGRKIESRVSRLADNGILTPAERLVYSMHEPGALGIFGKTEGDVIMTTLAQLSPLEKVVATSEYCRIMGRPFNPESGSNALLDDLRSLRGHDVRRAEQIAQIMPQDINGIVFEVSAFLNGQTNPIIDQWIKDNIGDPEEWIAKNFPDEDPRRPGVQSSGLEGLREMVNASGGPDKFAAMISMKPDKLVSSVRAMVTDSRGNGLSRMMMDFFGPEGAGIEVYARRVGAAVRDAELYRLEHGEITDKHAGQIQQEYAELMMRIAQHDQLKDNRVEVISNVALTVAIGGALIVAPEISPAVLFGIGAVTKAGTHISFGERDAVTLLKQAIRGGAAGLIAHFGAAQMASLEPDISLWLKAMHGGMVGAETAVMGGAVYRATEGKTWERGVARGGQELLEGAVHDAPIGFGVGVAVTLAAHYIQKAIDRLKNKDEPEPVPEDAPEPKDPIERPEPRPEPGEPPERPDPRPDVPDRPDPRPDPGGTGRPGQEIPDSGGGGTGRPGQGIPDSGGGGTGRPGGGTVPDSGGGTGRPPTGPGRGGVTPGTDPTGRTGTGTTGTTGRGGADVGAGTPGADVASGRVTPSGTATTTGRGATGGDVGGTGPAAGPGASTGRPSLTGTTTRPEVITPPGGRVLQPAPTGGRGDVAAGIVDPGIGVAAGTGRGAVVPGSSTTTTTTPTGAGDVAGRTGGLSAPTAGHQTITPPSGGVRITAPATGRAGLTGAVSETGSGVATNAGRGATGTVGTTTHTPPSSAGVPAARTGTTTPLRDSTGPAMSGRTGLTAPTTGGQPVRSPIGRNLVTAPTAGRGDITAGVSGPGGGEAAITGRGATGGLGNTTGATTTPSGTGLTSGRAGMGGTATTRPTDSLTTGRTSPTGTGPSRLTNTVGTGRTTALSDAQRVSFTRSLTSASSGRATAVATAPARTLPGTGRTVATGTTGPRPIIVPVNPHHIPTAPAPIATLQAGWQEAVIGTAPVGTLQVILGAEAYHWAKALAEPKGTTMPEAGWRDLIARAKATGIDVADEVPPTPSKKLALLEKIRHQAVAAAAQPDAQTIPVTAAQVGTKPVDEKAAAADAAAKAAAEAAASAQREAKVRQERIDTLAAHPFFAGADKAWIAEHANDAAAFMTGEPAGSFDKASAQEVIGRLEKTPEYVSSEMTGTLYDRMTMAERGLQSFGMPRDPALVDGIVDKNTKAAFATAMALFGPCVSNEPEGVANGLRYYGGVMEYATRATGRRATPEGARLADLQKIVRDYKKQIIDAGLLSADNTSSTFDKATLDAHKAFVVKKEEEARIAAEKAKVKEQVDGAAGRLTEATHALDDGVSEEDVLEVIEAHGSLAQLADQKAEGAAAALDGANSALVAALDTPDKVADFLFHSGGIESKATDDLIQNQIVGRYDQSQLAALGNRLALLEKGKLGTLASIPVGILDKVDDAMGATSPSRDLLKNATLERKAIRDVIREDFEALLAAPDALAGRRIGDLDPVKDKRALAAIANRLANQANRSNKYQRDAAELVLHIADNKPEVASEILRLMYKKLDSEEKDDFAMALSGPRDGHAGEKVYLANGYRTYDSAIAGLDSDVKETIAYSLYRDLGWYVYNDTERAFAYFLRGENARTDRYGRHKREPIEPRK